MVPLLLRYNKVQLYNRSLFLKFSGSKYALSHVQACDTSIVRAYFFLSFSCKAPYALWLSVSPVAHHSKASGQIMVKNCTSGQNQPRKNKYGLNYFNIQE